MKDPDPLKNGILKMPSIGRMPVKLPDLVPMKDPTAVFKAVIALLNRMFPEDISGPVQTVFRDILLLFSGNYTGYRACNTRYHDLAHTTDCLLAMARLIHGALEENRCISRHEVRMNLIAALMHDTGYIQTENDRRGTGAKYTLIHVQRSIEFWYSYAVAAGYSSDDIEYCTRCIQCTGLDVHVDRIPFRSESHALMGKILGAADLLGQMADRDYLEKLLYLYKEFEEGNVPGFADEYDLLLKTPSFFQACRQRIRNDLDRADRFMRSHFRAFHNLDRDLYEEAIGNHIGYLGDMLKRHGRNYREYLKRGGVVENLMSAPDAPAPQLHTPWDGNGSERRRHARFRASENTFVAVGLREAGQYAIEDISMGGLSFCYSEEKNGSGKMPLLKIYAGQNSDRVDRIVFRTISDVPYASSGVKPAVRRRGVRFLDLSEAQEKGLASFIEHHTRKEASTSY